MSKSTLEVVSNTLRLRAVRNGNQSDSPLSIVIERRLGSASNHSWFPSATITADELPMLVSIGTVMAVELQPRKDARSFAMPQWPEVTSSAVRESSADDDHPSHTLTSPSASLPAGSDNRPSCISASSAESPALTPEPQASNKIEAAAIPKETNEPPSLVDECEGDLGSGVAGPVPEKEQKVGDESTKGESSQSPKTKAKASTTTEPKSAATGRSNRSSSRASVSKSGSTTQSAKQRVNKVTVAAVRRSSRER